MSSSIPATDLELQDAVAEELAWLPSVPADRVRVAVHEGVVTLTGRVDTILERQAAVRAAFRVRGVDAVADDIDVTGGADPSPHAGLAHSVGVVLTLAEPAAGSVKADVLDHAVVLSGVVDWNFQRDAVAAAVAGVVGVREVRNDVTLTPRPAPVGPQAARQIRAALRRNAALDPLVVSALQIRVTGATVTLSGRVGSWSQRRQVVHAAWCAPGVTRVDDDLVVAPRR